MMFQKVIILILSMRIKKFKYVGINSSEHSFCIKDMLKFNNDNCKKFMSDHKTM